MQGSTSTSNIYLFPGRECGVRVATSDTPGPTILLTNVPSFVTLPDFLSEISPFSSSISIARMVLTDMPDSYGAVVGMLSVESAVELKKEMNLRPISALAKESLFVEYVENVLDFPGGLAALLTPPLECDKMASVTGKKRGGGDGGMVRSESEMSGAGGSHEYTGSQSSPSSSKTNRREASADNYQRNSPLQASAQCTICLESLFESAQIITTCGHAFHIDCFSRVQDEVCPLCRYSISEDPATRTSCATCSATHDLWMCLICGTVSCGRSVSGHGLQHHEETGHNYTLQVGGFRVWDYSSDSFVHRLISAEDDSESLVDMSAKNAWWFDEDDNDELERAVFASKTEAVAEFYSTLLHDQLQKQEQHYTKLLGEAGAQSSQYNLETAETEERHRIAVAAVTGYRRLVASQRLAILGNQQPIRGEIRKIGKETEEMKLTIESLTQAQNKVSGIVDDAKAKHAAKMAPLQKRMETLQAEFEKLLSNFQ